MEIIHKKNDIDFGVSTEFNSKYLTPIINNLLFKAENEWDDYNEVYHCSSLIENVRKSKYMNMDFHIMRKDEKYLGIALVTKGTIDYKTFFKEPIPINEKIRMSWYLTISIYLKEEEGMVKYGLEILLCRTINLNILKPSM